MKQKTIALVYDFDGTLVPDTMHDHSILPELGVNGPAFWRAVMQETKRTNGDHMLTYLRLLRDKIQDHSPHIDRRDLKRLGQKIKYFKGVSSWFDRINRHVQRSAPSYVNVSHYLISAGLKEILEGTTIRKYFKRVYASEYFYNQHRVPVFPNVVVNDTGKTQFLFRINKGRELPDESINEHMPERDRPIPFSNMIYIGDGMTDVPSMTVTKKNGGFAIAVHKPKDRRGLDICRKLLEANRVDYFAPADYSARSSLETYVKNIVDLISARIHHNYESHRARRGSHK